MEADMLKTKTLLIISAALFLCLSLGCWHYFSKKKKDNSKNQETQMSQSDYRSKVDKTRHNDNKNDQGGNQNIDEDKWQDDSEFILNDDENVDTNEESDSEQLANELNLQPIYFSFDQSSIKSDEMEKLENIAVYLKENQELSILLEGHCDERGSEEYNRLLGEERAISVREYLIEMGIEASRIKTLSFGEETPASNGLSEEDHRLNRRVVTKILN